MSETADAALMNIARQFSRIPARELAWFVHEVCGSALRRLEPADRVGILRHLKSSLVVPANGHGATVQKEVHSPPENGSLPGSNQVHEPGSNLVLEPVQNHVREGGKGGGFDLFWSSYPRKQAKIQAEKAWKGLKVSADLLQEMLAAIETQKRSEQWQRHRKFIPLPATWLNNQRWTDEVQLDEPVQVHLDAPIEWGQPGSLMRLWNDHTPAECVAVETASADRVANERRALTAHPEIAYWIEVCDQIKHSRKLRAKLPTDQGGLAHALDFDRLLSVDARYGVVWAVRVHDGHYRDA